MCTETARCDALDHMPPHQYLVWLHNRIVHQYHADYNAEWLKPLKDIIDWMKLEEAASGL
jgi:hypothetical protein